MGGGSGVEWGRHDGTAAQRKHRALPPLRTHAAQCMCVARTHTRVVRPLIRLRVCARMRIVPVGVQDEDALGVGSACWRRGGGESRVWRREEGEAGPFGSSCCTRATHTCVRVACSCVGGLAGTHTRTRPAVHMAGCPHCVPGVTLISTGTGGRCLAVGGWLVRVVA